MRGARCKRIKLTNKRIRKRAFKPIKRVKRVSKNSAALKTKNYFIPLRPGTRKFKRRAPIYVFKSHL
jgi:hypothetical protein